MDISRGNLGMTMVPYRYTSKRIAKRWRSENVVTAMGLGFTVFCSVSYDNFFIVIYTFLSLWVLISVTHSWYLKRWNILKKMNSLKKGEGVPLLNFEGGAGSWVPGSRGPGPRGPGPTFAPCWHVCPTSQLKRILHYRFNRIWFIEINKLHNLITEKLSFSKNCKLILINWKVWTCSNVSTN